MQIREELINTIYGLTELTFDYNIKCNYKVIINSILYLAPFDCRPKGLTTAGHLKYAYLRSQIANIIPKGSNIYLEICGVNSILLGLALVKHGCHIICFPHNIEAMVPGANTRLFRTKFCWLENEIALYEKSESVQCISTLDQSILLCHGINAKFYPYYPCSERLEFLKSLKSKREKHVNQKGEFLLFTSVNNPPTFTAVTNFLQLIIKNKSKINLIVAGRGTSKLKCFSSNSIRILGEVEDELSTKLLVEASFSIIPVIQTTGMLTKLIENNLIGIPSIVIGCYLQAQLLYEYGIITFDNSDDFTDHDLKCIKSNFQAFTFPVFNNSLNN